MKRLSGKPNIFWLVTPLLLLVVLFSFFVSKVVTHAAGISQVRFVQAAVGTSHVDVFVDGQQWLSNINYATVTDYQSAPSGTHTYKVAPAGQGIGAAIITQTVTTDADGLYTVAGIGANASSYSLVQYADNDLVPSAGMIKGRIYHLSPDTPPVNIDAGVPGAPTQDGLSYKDASQYLIVPPGTYTLTAVSPQTGTKLPFSVTMPGGYVYSIFMIGLSSGQPTLEFVKGVAQAIPGLPQTGSDPNATPVAAANQSLWLLASILSGLLLLAVASFTGWRVIALRKQFR